jgi:hypothetical protein
MPYVADAGPILSFARAHHLPLLHAVLGTLLIPEAVHVEIVVRGAGKPGAAEVQDAAWIVRTPVKDQALMASLPTHLDRGEREALALAKERGVGLLVDDREARRVARQQRIPHFGSLRVLQEGKARGLLAAVKPTLDALIAAGTFLDDTLYVAFLRSVGEG